MCAGLLAREGEKVWMLWSREFFQIWPKLTQLPVIIKNRSVQGH
jgi:hypothetical protein